MSTLDLEFTQTGFRIHRGLTFRTIDKRQYWLKRIWLSYALILLPLAGVSIFFGLAIASESREHLSPFSVSVRGYYRQDGTYIRPHSRRPPGGASHDAPYEGKVGQGEWLTIIGSVAGIVGLWRLFITEPVDLLPRVRLHGKLVRSVNVPLQSACARKSWGCQRCPKEIHPGEVYFYWTESRDRKRYCASCYGELKSQHSELRAIRIRQLDEVFTMALIQEKEV